MIRLVWGASLVAVLAIASQASAQAPLTGESVVSPGAIWRPPPETMPGGTVVLRGSPAANDVSLPALERSGREATDYQPAVTLPPGGGWNHRYNTAGVDNSYDAAGFDPRRDVNYDTTGIDQRFDRNGLTR